MYKKYIINALLLIAAMVVVSSCEKTNSMHEPYLENGEVTYRAKPDSSYAQGGFLRAKINWKIDKDEKITKSIISWNNGAGSMNVDLDRTDGNVWFSAMIEDLEEGSYFFELTNTDGQGNFSIPVKFETVVFGDLYVQSLKNRTVQRIVSPYNFPDSPEIKGAVITFGPAPEGLLGSIFEYTKMDGNQVSLEIAPTDMGLSLDDIDISKPVFIKSGFTPSDNALDIVYSERNEYMLERKWNVALGKAVTASQAGDYGTSFSTITNGDTDTNWPKILYINDGGVGDLWIEVDLGEVFDISKIVLFDRAGCCEMLKNYHIFISDVPFYESTVPGIQAQEGVVDMYVQTDPKTVQEFNDLNLTGRYIRIQNHLTSDVELGLGEIQVFN
ncbi:DUF4998 domain-containing protein [Mariniphaga sediminis]|uniref:DUF4998 domain-containing protein n=1 Tax=Mariniphaga sediminis TaxID=1628158 RepID=UPI003568EC3C